MKNSNQAMAVSITSAALIAAVAIVSAIHLCVLATRFADSR